MLARRLPSDVRLQVAGRRELNPYGFLGNSPCDYVDPTGLAAAAIAHDWKQDGPVKIQRVGMPFFIVKVQGAALPMPVLAKIGVELLQESFYRRATIDNWIDTSTPRRWSLGGVPCYCEYRLTQRCKRCITYIYQDGDGAPQRSTDVMQRKTFSESPVFTRARMVAWGPYSYSCPCKPPPRRTLCPR